jgi:hypothetical protein
MISRRKFLRNSGAFAIGSLVLARPLSGAALRNLSPMHAVGIQLYTVMGKMDEDLDGTLKKIGEIGYRDIESAFSRKGGFYGMTSKEFAMKVKDHGLSWRAHHVGGAPYKPAPGAKPPTGPDGKPIVIPPMKNLRENMQEVVDAAAEGGIEWLVCSSTSIGTLDEIKQSAETLNKTGEACKKAGIGFAYHNHWKEFEKVEGQLPYDTFLQISPDIMKLELDLAWATKAGMDPVELFKKNPGRFLLWHVKDLNKETQKPVEVGAGYIDFKPIFENAKLAGMKYFFVEQDGAPQPFDNITTSFNNLKKIMA